MKNVKEYLLNVLMVIMFAVFTLSCANTGQNENHDHEEMMDEDHTEIMENEDHMEDGDHMHDQQSDEHMMNDTTSMDLNEEMRQ